MEHLNASNVIWKPLYTIEEAEKIVIGIPYGVAKDAPQRIRELFRSNFWTYDLERGDLFDKKIVDLGDVKVASYDSLIKNLENIVREILGKNPDVRIVFLGGEHSVTFPIAKALKIKSILSLDAHPDLCNEFENDKYSKACTQRRIYELGSKVHLRGVRTASKEEHDFLMKNNIDWKRELDFKGKVDYLTIDVDVLDPSFIGVAAPEALGFSVKDIINQIRNVDFRHCDIVEWVPDFGYPAVVQILKELLWK